MSKPKIITPAGSLAEQMDAEQEARPDPIPPPFDVEKLEAFNDTLVLRMDRAATQTTGGLLIPPTARKSTSRLAGTTGVVLAKGSDVPEKIRIGDRLVWWTGAAMQLSEDVMVTQWETIIGRIPRKQK